MFQGTKRDFEYTGTERKQNGGDSVKVAARYQRIDCFLFHFFLFREVGFSFVSVLAIDLSNFRNKMCEAPL